MTGPRTQLQRRVQSEMGSALLCSLPQAVTPENRDCSWGEGREAGEGGVSSRAGAWN